MTSYPRELTSALIAWAKDNPEIADKAWRTAGTLSDSIESQTIEYYRALLRYQSDWNNSDAFDCTVGWWEYLAKRAHLRCAEFLREANEWQGWPEYQATLRARAYECSRNATYAHKAALNAALWPTEEVSQ